MEYGKKFEPLLGPDDGTDPMKNVDRTKFSKAILRQVVGDNRAQMVLQSMSMAIIPKTGGSMGSVLKDSEYIFYFHIFSKFTIIFHHHPSHF